MSFFGRLFYGDAWRADDANGRWVRLFDPFEMAFSSVVRGEFSRSEFKRVQKEMRTSRTNSERLKEESYWVSVLVCLYLPLMCVVPSIGSLGRNLLLQAGIFIVMWMLARRFYIPIRPIAFSRAMRSIGRCPSCAYQMAGSHEAGEKWICPECGAAWVISKGESQT